MNTDQSNSTLEGVDDSLYGEGDPKPAADRAKPDSVDEQSAEQATDLMSKTSFPGGCKVGDTYSVEITGDHGDQFSVKVEKPGEKETNEKPEASEGADPELAEVNGRY